MHVDDARTWFFSALAVPVRGLVCSSPATLFLEFTWNRSEGMEHIGFKVSSIMHLETLFRWSHVLSSSTNMDCRSLFH